MGGEVDRVDHILIFLALISLIKIEIHYYFFKTAARN